MSLNAIEPSVDHICICNRKVLIVGDFWDMESLRLLEYDENMGVLSSFDQLN